MLLKRQNHLKPLSALVLLAALLLVVCCKKKDVSKEEENSDAGFNKQELLVNLADNIILPCYTEFKRSLDSLTLGYEAFKISGSQSDFATVKQKLNVAYLRYQRISLFGFGPGEDAAVRTNFNIFPTDTAKIKANINSGSYNLSSATNFATKGFPALDYLFNDNTRSESALVLGFTSDAKRKTYVSDLLNEMSVKTTAVLTAWNSTYRSTFINSLGTDVGSSLGYVINQLNYELDYLKNSKIATPLGLRSGGTPLPNNSEALYSAMSLSYALETLNTLENVYLGKSFSGKNGIGFDDYLDHLKIQHGEASLNVAINSQFVMARTKLNAIGNPLSEKVATTPSLVNDAYKELVKLLVLLKTDMPSSLGVVITYQDGDGD